MSQMDFIVAISLVVGMISLSVFFSASNVTDKSSMIDSYYLKNSRDILTYHLFDTSLREDAKQVQIMLQEEGAYAHEEDVSVYMSGSFDNMHVYDKSMNEIESSVSGSEVTLNINFKPNERKYFDIFYIGEAGDITYDAVNVSAVILSEKDVSFISLEKCSLLDYYDIKQNVGYDFRVEFGGCIIGTDPPESGNIFASQYPVIIFGQHGIETDMVQIKMW